MKRNDVVSVFAASCIIGLACLAINAATQRPTLSIGPGNAVNRSVSLYGQTNVYYRIETSTDLTN